MTDWQARDARREAHEAQMAAQRAESRAKHVATASEALVARWPGITNAYALAYAEAVVDALLSSGVIFAAMGTWDGSDE